MGFLEAEEFVSAALNVYHLFPWTHVKLLANAYPLTILAVVNGELEV